VGRNGQADPRWLLPFICRRGHLTRREVGRIQVMDRETRVEIAPWAAERFAAAAQRPAQDEEDDIRIEPLGDAHSPGAAPRRSAAPPRAPARPPGPRPKRAVRRPS
jgi:ATP-dependent RNA helicase DeaD